ncbi:MAG: hypothetical protein AAF997_00885 [Myxococcota bacterium]
MRWLAIAFALCAGCGQTGGEFVDVPFSGQGTAPEPFVSDGWEVLLSQATLGFGPIFFCTTESPDPRRCDPAILEFRDGVTLDGLDPNEQFIGELFGTTGTINTAFYDFGIVWLLTIPLAQALAGVPGGPASVPFEAPNYVPGGHSGRFFGSATCIEGPEVCCPEADTCPTSYEFEAFVDVVPGTRGRPTINGVEAPVTITPEPVSLLITFDPNAWFQTVNYGRVAALVDESGLAALGPADPDYNNIVIAMSGNPFPTFTWSTTGTTE